MAPKKQLVKNKMNQIELKNKSNNNNNDGNEAAAATAAAVINDNANTIDDDDDNLEEIEDIDDDDDNEITKINNITLPVLRGDDHQIKWTCDDIRQLLANIQQQLSSSTDLTKYTTTIEKRLDWNRIKFSNYNETDCRKCLAQLLLNVRKYRTLSEILTDLHKLLDQSITSTPNQLQSRQKVWLKHPDRPRKPVSSFIRFFLEKKEKMQRKYPNITIGEISKILATKFEKLSEQKRQKYREDYDREMIEYRKKLIEFRRKCPELFSKNSKISLLTTTSLENEPQKPRTPFQLFQLSKLKKYDWWPNNNGITSEQLKEIKEQIREQWKQISDRKHYKFIKKSLKDEQRYLNELEEFRLKNPQIEFEPIRRPLLTKYEQELKHRFQGMPERPPNNGYMLFSQIMMKELDDIPAKERMIVVAKHWREMSEQEKQKYNDDSQTMIKEFAAKFNEYLNTLTDEDEKKQLMEDNKNIIKLSNDQQQQSTTPKKHYSSSIYETAMIAYQMNEMQRSTSTSTKSSEELMKSIKNGWNTMPSDEKEKYLNMAKSLMQQHSKQSTSSDNHDNNSNDNDDGASSPTGQNLKKEPKFKDPIELEFFRRTNIRKPVRSAFRIYCSHILSTMKDKTTQNRMCHASNEWKQMPQGEKNKYLRIAVKKYDLYLKLLNRFRMNDQLLPTSEELKRLESNSLDLDWPDDDGDNNNGNNAEPNDPGHTKIIDPSPDNDSPRAVGEKTTGKTTSKGSKGEKISAKKGSKRKQQTVIAEELNSSRSDVDDGHDHDRLPPKPPAPPLVNIKEESLSDDDDHDHDRRPPTPLVNLKAEESSLSSSSSDDDDDEDAELLLNAIASSATTATPQTKRKKFSSCLYDNNNIDNDDDDLSMD